MNNGIVTPISDTGSQIDIVGFAIFFAVILIVYFVWSKRKENKEEIRHFRDEPEVWDD